MENNPDVIQLSFHALIIKLRAFEKTLTPEQLDLYRNEIEKSKDDYLLTHQEVFDLSHCKLFDQLLL